MSFRGFLYLIFSNECFTGKNLICCETACKSFRDIVDIIGGPSEKDRTEKLLSRVRVVPDIPFNGLKLGGKIKPRSVIIFGTGYHHRAVTATANEGFIRASKHQVHVIILSVLCLKKKI